MAIENGMGVGRTRRWMMAFGFGLLLGLRFSLALRETLQFAGAHALTSLASFGIGADLGQMLLLLLLFPAVQLLFRLATERAATFVVSLMAGDISWHWMRDRAELLRQYQFQWPAVTPALTLAIVTWATDLVIAAAVFWLLFTAIPQIDLRQSSLWRGR